MQMFKISMFRQYKIQQYNTEHLKRIPKIP